MSPALSRWLLFIPEAPPWTDLLPNLPDLFLVALAMHDLRTLGRVHPATWWCIALLVPIHIVTPFLIASDWWRGIAPAIMMLAV